jgi:diketogulonate reductase-like aldo/keto reductase
LLKALLSGTCTGIAVLNPDDRGVLMLVRQTLHTVLTKKPQLHRSSFTVVVGSSAAWAVETFSERVRDITGHLQLEVLDVLLLARPPSLQVLMPTSQRKRLVLQHWEEMCSVQQRGLVRVIGVTDFTIQEMEFMFTSSPTSPPTVVSATAGLAPARARTTKPAIPDISLRALVSFAHGRRMDVVIYFAYHVLNDLPSQLPLRDQWRQVVRTIAQRQRKEQFEVQVVHEADQEAYHLEQCDMKDTSTLQTSTQIVLRYLWQKGVVVVPLPDSEDGGDQFTEEESHTVFHDFLHPFSSLPPARSPQVQYASVLSKEELLLIDQVLPFMVSFTK